MMSFKSTESVRCFWFDKRGSKMKLTKWTLLGIAGLVLVFLPRRSSPKAPTQTTNTNQTTQDHNTQNKKEHDDM